MRLGPLCHRTDTTKADKQKRQTPLGQTPVSYHNSELQITCHVIALHPDHDQVLLIERNDGFSLPGFLALEHATGATRHINRCMLELFRIQTVVLRLVGRELARIHKAMFAFPLTPGSERPLDLWLEEMTDRLLATAEECSASVQRLMETIPSDLTQLEIPWGLSHGDVRGANVLYDGQRLGFTDLNPNMLPLLRDVVMVRSKWLMNGTSSDRLLAGREMADFVLCYVAERALTGAELAAFPVVWAVDRADRLLRQRRSLKGTLPTVSRRREVAAQLQTLPEEMDRGREILELTVGSLPPD